MKTRTKRNTEVKMEQRKKWRVSEIWRKKGV